MIAAERINQDEQWGGRQHDQAHAIDEWCEYITKQVGRARSSSTDEQVKSRLVKIAALALAALESL